MEVSANQQYFVINLIRWNTNENTREMPWKGEKDPYKIWLSEIILQQTRVSQGLNYYERFLNAFPTVNDLARAPAQEVFKLWEGLGYYTRCKNLIATAKYISNNLEGVFPAEYSSILSLKGIGPYTAAAIGSFAFNLPHAVVDGNVFRVLSRYFGIETSIDSTEGIKFFKALANDLLDKAQPGIYNQSLMDFGAIICKPQLPLCAVCVLKKRCTAFLQGTVQQLPVKKKPPAKRKRWFYYFIINMNGHLYVRKRKAGDIWENLYEFCLIENNREMDLEELKKATREIAGKANFEVEYLSPVYKQQLTHQTIIGRFINIKTDELFSLKGYTPVGKKALQKLPFPKFISNYLKDKNVSLNLF